MIEVVILSLKVASAAMLVSLPLALGVALVLTRLQFRGQFLLRLIAYLPLVLPPTNAVIGLSSISSVWIRLKSLTSILSRRTFKTMPYEYM